MSKRSGLYPLVRVDAAAVPAVAHAGGALVSRTAHASGLGAALHEALGPWRKPLARHDPAKVVLDLATSLALGGDACSDAALLRAARRACGDPAMDHAALNRLSEQWRPLRAVAARLLWLDLFGPAPDGG